MHTYSREFRDHDEKIRFSKVLDLIYQLESEKTKVFSDFFSSALIEKINNVIEKDRLCSYVFIWGGMEDAERKVFCFSQNNEEPEFPIVCLKISFNKKFAKNLTHRDFLGSILGMGLNRDKVGDILVKDDFAYAFVLKDISDFLIYNLDKVGRVPVKVSMADEDADFFNPEIMPDRIIVSSLRLDAVISSGFKLSRGKAVSMINSDKAYINWSLANSASKQINPGDIITVRGMGRIEVIGIAGKSKKDKILLDVIVKS